LLAFLAARPKRNSSTPHAHAAHHNVAYSYLSHDNAAMSAIISPMNEDQFTKLFKYIEEFRAEVNQRFAETAANIDRLTNTIDSFVKRLDDNETEQTARDYQFEKLLAWARKVSEKTGIPLENL
jgi:septal ring factor EnvC (AmiA/AmiB activator)